MASELPPSKRARVALPSSAPGVYVARRFVSGGGGRGFVAVGRSSTSSATHVCIYIYISIVAIPFERDTRVLYLCFGVVLHGVLL